MNRSHPLRLLVATRSAGTIRNDRRDRGFTILEILIAIALVGLVMVGLNTFVFSMGELWGRGSDVRLFDQHVRSVSRFLERELRTAALPPNVSAGTGAIAPKEIKSGLGLDRHLLTFELKEGSRLLLWPERALPEVVCSLTVRDGTGLVLLWHSRLEKRFQDDPPRETTLSPMVVSMAYDYYDTEFKRWETLNALRPTRGQRDAYDTPQRLRLTFKHGQLTEESIISLPQATEGLPFF